MNKVSLKVEVQSKASEYSLQYCIEKYLEEAGFDNVVVEPLKAQKPGWISVKDRLPEEKQFVLVYGESLYSNKHDAGCMAVSWRVDYNYWFGFGRTGAITHWMPLPEPPKEEEHGNVD